MIDFEKNELALVVEQNDLQSFWQWEANLLREEVEYFEQNLRDLKAKIDTEADLKVAEELKKVVKADLKGDNAQRILTDDPKFIKASGKRVSKTEKIRNDVEAKFFAHKKFLIESYERAKFEE